MRSTSPSWRAFAVALVCALTTGAGAQTDQPQPVALANTAQRKITSVAIGQTYDLLVSLPEDYPSSKVRYPVLYALDGWHFPLLAFLQQNNTGAHRMRPVIIVNISYGNDPKLMALRARDMTPDHLDREPTSGGGPAFLKFLAEELIPFIDRTYRTKPDDRALLGHSLGGLFAIYALEHRPELFQRIVAASPSLFWHDKELIAQARSTLRSLPTPVRLDLSAGDANDNTAVTAEFAKLLGALKPTNLTYRFSLYPGENHNSVRLESIPKGLYWIYAKD